MCHQSELKHSSNPMGEKKEEKETQGSLKEAMALGDLVCPPKNKSLHVTHTRITVIFLHMLKSVS